MRYAVGPIALLLLALIGLSGCQRVQPIYEVNQRVLPTAASSMSLQQIEDRIKRVAVKNKWRVSAIGPGQLLAMNTWRGHSGTVVIEYSQSAFSIHYKSSTNLLEDTGKEGEAVIHRNFNKRVRALERAIDVELTFPN